jgi:O-antigen/teichoic acid export membrane protein
LLSQSWSVLFTSITVILHMRTDQIMIKNMIDDTSLGYYSAAIKLCESWYFIPGIITSSIFPKLLELRNTNTEKFENAIIQGYSILLYISVLVAILISLNSELIISLLFGKEYAPASSIVLLYVWSGVLIAISYLSGKWFYCNNLEIYKFLFTVIGLGVNLVFNYLFINHFGYEGAAYATIVSLIFYVFILNIFFRKTRKNFFLIIKSINPKYFFNASVFNKAKEKIVNKFTQKNN